VKAASTGWLLGLTLWALGAPAAAQVQTVSEIQVTPETMTLGVNQKQALFAAAFDSRGNLIPSAKFVFSSSDTMIARVRKDGSVIGVSPGLARIEARSQGKRASMAILITGTAPPDTPARSAATVMTLEPSSVVLLPGENIRVTPQALRDDGTAVATGRVVWKSLRPEVASVDSAGIVTGVAPGRTIVQAATGSRLMATLPVEVSQADIALSRSRLTLGVDEVDTLRAEIPAQDNREIRGLVQWRSTDSSVVTVDPTGIVRGRSPGRAEIVFSAFSQERRAAVLVHRTPEALVVSPHHGPEPIQVPLRADRQFSAVAETADSTPIPEARITWELGDTAIAAFNTATGVLTPKAVGSTTLTARLPGIQPAVWQIQIVPGEIALEPSRIGLAAGQRTTLSAVLRDDKGVRVGRTSAAQWSSDHPEVATVREGGLVEALTPGHTVVSGTAPWGKVANADVYVVGDLMLTSNRGGSFGIYQLRIGALATFVPLLVDTATNIQAVLSPDRTRVVFSSNRNGTYDLYIMDADGQHLRRLTSEAGSEGEPAWTPDGQNVIYTSVRGSVAHIAMVSTSGGQVRQLTSEAPGNHSPSVSPDGRTIAFVSSRDGNPEIYAMGLDGTNPRRLTRTLLRESNPHFYRNGDLAYVVDRGDGSKGSRIMRLAWGSSESSVVLETDEPIPSFAISRDGDRLVYVLGRIRDAAKGKVDFSFFLQSTAPGSRATAIPLRPGEQVLSPSF
jgi:uncharacterized protein YjdB